MNARHGHRDTGLDRVRFVGGSLDPVLEAFECAQPGRGQHTVAVAEAVIERADGCAAGRRDRRDAGGAGSVDEHEGARCVEDHVGVVLAGGAMY